MHSQPLRGEANRRRAEEQFKTTKKVNAETKVNTPRQVEAEKTARLRALRLAKEVADKDTATRRQQRPVDLSRVGAFQDLGLQVRQSASKSPGTDVRDDALNQIPLGRRVKRLTSAAPQRRSGRRRFGRQIGPPYPPI